MIAELLAMLDGSDPSPSWEECARRAGIEVPVTRPGDQFACEVDLAYYWPTVRPCWEGR